MKAHKFDGISFFSGLVITLVGLLFLIPSQPTDVIDALGRIGNWFWPALFVAIGVAVLIPALTMGRKSGDDESEGDQDVTG